MKRYFTLMLAIALTLTNATGQNKFPNLDANALVAAHHDLSQLNKPYTVVIYGGVGCGYSKYLIQNLDVLSACKDKCDVILIMDQPKDSIAKHMQSVIQQYPTFSNAVLQYKLKKKNDIFPQLLLFKNREQIEHIVGVKEGMLTNTKKIVMESK